MAATRGWEALRRALLVDAAASGTMGVLLVVAATPLEPLLGLSAALLRGVGLFLVPFAGFLSWLVSRLPVPRSVVWVVVVGNALWVVASIALLASGLVAPTALGTAFVLAQAAAVALFAHLEYDALRRG